MTRDEFKHIVFTKQDFDFEYKGITYLMTYENTPEGYNILLGEQYLKPEVYENFTHLMADAKIQNHYLRELISVL